jgi:hypothetical protein
MAQGYHFPMLPAAFTREELHAVVFGDAQVSETGHALGHGIRTLCRAL